MDESLLFEKEWDLVDCLHISYGNDLLGVSMAAAGDFLDCLDGEGTFATACDLVLLVTF